METSKMRKIIVLFLQELLEELVLNKKLNHDNLEKLLLIIYNELLLDFQDVEIKSILLSLLSYYNTNKSITNNINCDCNDNSFNFKNNNGVNSLYNNDFVNEILLFLKNADAKIDWTDFDKEVDQENASFILDAFLNNTNKDNPKIKLN